MAGECILIVDDNPLNSELMSETLEFAGYQARSAADAEEALAILKTHRPGLIVMDIQLPGMDGLELTRLIKANPETRHITVVAVTSYAMKGDEAKALASGCDGYISKPIDTRAFPDQIGKYFRKRRDRD